MPDAVIRADAIQAAPAGYKVPGAQEIVVKSVRAVVDGTGAGATFEAVLQLIDPAGNVVWQSATDAGIAAGASADVSWFPRVGGGTSGPAPSGSGLPWAFYETVSGPTVTSGTGLHTIDLDPTGNTFVTSDNTIFAITTSGGFHVLEILANGIYWVTAFIQMDFNAAATAGSGGTLQMTGSNHVVGGARDNAWISDPASAGRSKCTPSFEGIYNLDPGSTAPPITPALQVGQNGGSTTTATIVDLFAVQINPTGSPLF